MMDTILKAGLLTLLVVMASSQAAIADSAEDKNGLVFSQTEIALLDELDDERGKEGVDYMTLNNMNVRATLSGDANNNVTGFNIIDHGAFTDAAGMVSVIQNTGNNVLIQDATIVNVTIMP
ncbi:hypothetical protein [Methylobacter luteus]|uniref:hypothetical protein n=1 Tax=Methylobacter luteus TaxID=415 RepID=UPI001E40E47E|nr:hypothetical protein [Methylobacter luteus]